MRKLWLVAIAFPVGVFVYVSWPSNEPQFNGMSASQWFQESLRPVEGKSSWLSKTNVVHAFMEMEGDAVPFLSQITARKPSWSNVTYRRAREGARWTLPWCIAKWLPEAEAQESRRLRAVTILGDIGDLQRTKADSGVASSKPSITNALPALLTALKDTNGIIFALFAAQSLGQIGPLAAQAIPDLLRIAENASVKDLPTYMRSLGSMGALASNAVPLLLSILINTNHSELVREFAIMALGSIGSSAAPAAPAIVPFLSHTNYSPVHNSTWALASIGATPDEAVPIFEAMTRNPKNPDTLAAVALWNRDHDTTKLCKCLKDALNANRKDMALSALGLLGTNAIPCALKIEELIDDPDTNISRNAKNVLRKMKPAA